MSTVDNQGTNPSDTTSKTIDEVKDEISQVSDVGAEAAKDVADTRFEQGREATTVQLDNASDAMSDVAQKLQENDSPFASYASELSEQLSSFSNKLSTSSIDDLVGGARSLARDNPAAFMLGSMAIGLAASRFFKATGEQISHQSKASATPSDTQYTQSGRDQRHRYDPAGMHNTGQGLDTQHAHTAGTSSANTVTPPTGNTTVGQINTDGSTDQHDKVAGHAGRVTREEA